MYCMNNKNYGSIFNKDIYDLIPEGDYQILDIGCSEGALLHQLKADKKASYTVGIDISQEALEKAKEHTDKTLHIDIEKENLPTDLHKSFDYIIFADSIEHMLKPWNVINKCKAYLKEGGKMLFCIPNVRNIVVITDLIKGNWSYTSAGLLDVNHYRFFTYKSSLYLFEKTGLKVTAHKRLLKNADWHRTMNGPGKLDENILKLHDVILNKFNTEEDCSKELSILFGNFNFPRLDVAELLTGQFIFETEVA